MTTSTKLLSQHLAQAYPHVASPKGHVNQVSIVGQEVMMDNYILGKKFEYVSNEKLVCHALDAKDMPSSFKI